MYPKLASLYFSLEYISIVYFSLNLSSHWRGLLLVPAYKADIVSPLELAASWRVYKENFQPSRVRGIPDISINVAPTHATEMRAFNLDA